MAGTTTKEIDFYITPDGKNPFKEWYESLKDKRAKLEVGRRLDRAAAGNSGDHKTLVEGLMEMKITYSPGYRIYYTETDERIIVLLCGGTKKTQPQDILKAKGYLEDYLEGKNL
jgi:putative addiction module killer protein